MIAFVSNSWLHIISVVIVISGTIGVSSQGRSFGETCTTDLNCDLTKSLSCNNNGICGCQYTWQIYDQKQTVCLSPVGGFCKIDGTLNCGANAYCSSNTEFLGFCLCDAFFTATLALSCEDNNKNSTVVIKNNRGVNSQMPLICCRQPSSPSPSSVKVNSGKN